MNDQVLEYIAETERVNENNSISNRTSINYIP